jgi:DCN1-like protein 4/5
MEKLFATYADTDDSSYIGADGLERLCTDSNICMDGPQLLILAWFLRASELGKFAKEEWLKGCDVLKSALLPLFLHLSVLSEL